MNKYCLQYIFTSYTYLMNLIRVRLRQSCSDRAPSELCAPESALPIYTEQKIVTEVQNLLAKRSYFKF